ncbi:MULTISPECIES: envelope stress response membrane protein PspB [Hyphomonas]|jgi:phage shock protein B|uniref:Phage shock protein B n=1 Tax=Hyphomonas jannaschiana VP2 TaxID=1280952 RepID=A0A059FL89_9PROT|nr:envelope stress response membrane protein PspB [Hyphomonas jannaschiana]KCZ91415.1 phage shock protein B [Hyphomonas jannaschiana VP2]MCA8890549.1 envelope stress response membrane protein PspB [Hyphomonas sp.]
MPEEFMAIAIVGIIFIGFPGIIFHYITQWRKQKTLMPDDERMMEDLWRSAKAMERRIETLERLLEAGEAEEQRPPPRRSRPTFDD